jgi:hypothetical protein
VASSVLAIVICALFTAQIQDRVEVTSIADLYVLQGHGLLEGSRMPDELKFIDEAWGISADQFAMLRQADGSSTDTKLSFLAELDALKSMQKTDEIGRCGIFDGSANANVIAAKCQSEPYKSKSIY